MTATLTAQCRRHLLKLSSSNRVPYRVTRLPFRLGLKPLHDPVREHAELRQYLGDSFEPRQLQDPVKLVDDELAQIGDEGELYRTSRGYLYNLTAFAMSTTKDPYLADLETFIPAPARVLDYGCGIGSDGLYLIDRGYRVGFADFDNPSTAYLRWRLANRGVSGDIYDLDRSEVPSGFDLAFSFDVIEHVPDPFDFLSRMESHADYVLVNLLEPVENDTPLHHHLPVRDLLEYVIGRGLQRYSLHYGFSHLVLYHPGAAGRPAAVRAARRAMARIGR